MVITDFSSILEKKIKGDKVLRKNEQIRMER